MVACAPPEVGECLQPQPLLAPHFFDICYWLLDSLDLAIALSRAGELRCSDPAARDREALCKCLAHSVNLLTKVRTGRLCLPCPSSSAKRENNHPGPNRLPRPLFPGGLHIAPKTFILKVLKTKHKTSSRSKAPPIFLGKWTTTMYVRMP